MSSIVKLVNKKSDSLSFKFDKDKYYMVKPIFLGNVILVCNTEEIVGNPYEEDILNAEFLILETTKEQFIQTIKRNYHLYVTRGHEISSWIFINKDLSKCSNINEVIRIIKNIEDKDIVITDHDFVKNFIKTEPRKFRAWLKDEEAPRMEYFTMDEANAFIDMYGGNENYYLMEEMPYQGEKGPLYDGDIIVSNATLTVVSRVFGKFNEMFSFGHYTLMGNIFENPDLVKEIQSKQKEYEVWSEGYTVTGNSSNALYHGKFKAMSFKQACLFCFKGNSSFDYNDLSLWGCRLFESEEEARKSFG